MEREKDHQQQCGSHKSGLDAVLFAQELKLAPSLPNMARSKPASATGYPGLTHTDVPSTTSQPAHQHADQEATPDGSDFDLRKDLPKLGAFLVLFEEKRSSIVSRMNFAIDLHDV